jgi:hypothetical protein
MGGICKRGTARNSKRYQRIPDARAHRLKEESVDDAQSSSAGERIAASCRFPVGPCTAHPGALRLPVPFVQVGAPACSAEEATIMQPKSEFTTDHAKIRSWAEQRGDKAARVRGTGSDDDPGVLRIDFPGYSGEDELEPISWDEFFAKFEQSRLALVYQEQTSDGQRSNFNKLVNRDTVQA